MPGAASTLRYDTLCVRRPGLTRDLPPGTEELQWVSNTATLIFGERDAVLVDTFRRFVRQRVRFQPSSSSRSSLALCGYPGWWLASVEPQMGERRH